MLKQLSKLLCNGFKKMVRTGLLKSLRGLEIKTAFVEEEEKAISYHSESQSSNRALLWREE